MAINVALLDRTLAHIETHPEDWDQTIYRCGTAACFGGRAVILDGGKWTDTWQDVLKAAPDDDPDDIIDGTIGPYWRARRILGLTLAQADELFDMDNNLDDLRAIVYKLKVTAEHEATLQAITGGGA